LRAWGAQDTAVELEGLEAQWVPLPAAAAMAPGLDPLALFGGSAFVAASTAAWMQRLRQALYSRDGAATTAAAGVPVPVPGWMAGGDPRWGSVGAVGAVRGALAHYFDVVVGDLSDEITTMAPELAAAGGGGGLGGGGDDDDDGWGDEDGFGGHGGAGGGGNAGLPADLHAYAPGADGENPLVTFFRALMPWNVVVPRGAPPGDPPAE
jgi:hypothetical protein